MSDQHLLLFRAAGAILLIAISLLLFAPGAPSPEAGPVSQPATAATPAADVGIVAAMNAPRGKN